MATRTSRTVDKNRVLEGMNTALDNARRLLRDARLLQKGIRPGTAFALGTLALEEAGRVLALAIRAGTSRSRRKIDEALSQSFRPPQSTIPLVLSPHWKEIFVLRHHHLESLPVSPRKVARATDTFFRFLKKSAEPGEKAAATLARLRQRALLTDLDADKNVRPALEMPRPVASAFLTLAESEIGYLSRLRDVYRRGQTVRLGEQLLREAVQDIRREGMAEALDIGNLERFPLFAGSRRRSV